MAQHKVMSYREHAMVWLTKSTT